MYFVVLNMYKLTIFAFAFCYSILLIESDDEFQFRNLGTHYERNIFEKDAKFENFVFENLLNRNLTRDDYKILMKLGLKQYLKLIDAIEENKKIVISNQIIEDSTNFSKAADDSNLIFEGVRGFSSLKIENPQINSILDSKYEVRSVIHLPQLVFYGHLVDKNKAFEYKLEEVSYVITEFKKVDDDFQVKSVQAAEEIHYNKDELIIKGDKTSNRSLDREAQQKVSDYLSEVIGFIRASVPNYWAGADNWYLRQRKDQMVDKLIKIVLKTLKTFSTLGTDVPRFSFRDQQTSTNYEMINGFLEVDGGSIKSAMKNVNENGDIEMAFPLSGSLKYYVSELNCSSCHFYGYRFQATKTDVRVNFVNHTIGNVLWFFQMKYVETLVDNRLKTHNDNAFNVVLENVSKVVNERFRAFLKSFLGPVFFES